MLRGPDAQSTRFLTDLAEITKRMDRAQREITSGRRINTASDDGDQISSLLAARSDLGLAEQILENLGRIKTETDTAEQAISQSIDAMDRIVTLGTQGASDLVDANARATIASEIEQLLAQIVNLSNTQLEGRYLFAGDTDQVLPYTLDWTQADATSPYAGSTSTREAQHPSGLRFSLSLTADVIFDNSDPNKNVFDSVNELRTALNADDSTAVNAALGKARTSHTHLNSSLSFYGGVQNQVQAATDTAQKRIVTLQTQISNIQDADLTSAILELNQSRLLQETALQAQARRTQTSLFDYLR